jgi:hypothetical protein
MADGAAPVAGVIFLVQYRKSNECFGPQPSQHFVSPLKASVSNIVTYESKTVIVVKADFKGL